MKRRRAGTPFWKSGVPDSTASPGTIKGPLRLGRLGAWKAAARPHTLWASVAPVTVGTGLAIGDGVFRWDAFWMTLIVGVSIQVAANFANDVSDAARHADTPDRIGPPRMVAEGMITPKQMWIATWAAVAVALGAGLYLVLIAGPILVWVGLLSVGAMLTYVGGPWPYGYRGLGEVSVFVFFGLTATVGTRYVHDMTATPAAWMLAVPMGLLASAILVANNLRDIKTDARAGKRTLAVMMGEAPTRTFYGVLMGLALGAAAVAAATGVTPPATWAAQAVAPFVWTTVHKVLRGTKGVGLVGVLKATSRIQMGLALTLAVTTALWS